MGDERNRNVVIILVHGTGASLEGPVGDEKWWQPESAFARDLVEDLGRRPSPRGAAYSLESFKWSGNNSESDRREAGAALAARALALEQSGTAYHLVGHSHGGSVIWHALNHGISRGTQFHLLRSWITIGTPFLEFSPRNGLYLSLSTLSILLLAAMAWPLPQIVGDLSSEVVRRDAEALATMAVLIGLAGMLGLALYLLADVFTQLRLRLIGRRSRRWTSSIPSLSERWLGLAHDLDEPLNGLAASLSRPPEIAPRVRRSPAFGPVRRLIARLMSPYNLLVAPVVDAFVWDTGISRLQGRDISGTIMTASRTSPPNFPLSWPPLPSEILSGLSRRANEAASETAAAFREELVRVGSGAEPAERIARALSWNEVIHTTYFADRGVLELCSAFMHDRGSREAAADAPGLSLPSEVSSSAWLAAGPSTRNDRRGHFAPWNLYVAKAVGCVAAAAILSFGTVAAHEAWLRPYTNRFQVEAIHQNMATPQFTRLWESAAVGNVLVRLIALDLTDAAFVSLSGIRNPNTFIMAAERVAYGLGFYGDDASLARLLNEHASEDRGNTDIDEKLVLKTYALAGAVDGDSSLKPALVVELEGVLSKPDGALDFGRFDPMRVAATTLLRAGSLPGVNALLDTMAIACEDALVWIEENEYIPPTQSMSAELRACLERQPAPPSAKATDPAVPIAADLSPPDYHSPYEVADRVPDLVAQRDYGALSRMISSWNDEFGIDVAGAVSEASWVGMVESLRKAGHVESASRAVALYELLLRDRVDNDFSLSLAYHLERFEQFADGMLRIGQQAVLEADAARFEGEARDGTDAAIFGAAESAAKAAIIWLKLGNEDAAKASFGTAIETVRQMGESGFPFAMRMAEICSDLDPELTRRALAKAIDLFEDAFSIDSVPDYSYSLTDVARLYSKIGEYRRAREISERVGQRLGEFLGTRVVRDETSGPDPAAEKEELIGGGVLGGYIEILDAEIRSRSASGSPEIIDGIDRWPGPIPIYLTSFNRG